MKQKFRGTTLYKSMLLLSPRSRMKIYVVQALQILFGILDLVGVALIGVLGALAIQGVGSKTPGNRVNGVLEMLRIDNLEFQKQVAILGILATILFFLRTILSIVFTRKILHFLSHSGARISKELISKLLATNLTQINNQSNQQRLFAMTEGVNSVMIGTIGNVVSIVSDCSLLLIIGIGLFIVDPEVALLMLTVFTAIALVLYRLMHTKAKKLGETNAEFSIKSNELIFEVLNSFRESVASGRRYFYVEKIGEMRSRTASASAEINFMPNISKYVIETAVIFGSLIISAFQFLTQDASHAIATLSVFLAAGSRIAPAMLRVQQGLLNMKGNSGVAETTLKLAEELAQQKGINPSIKKFDLEHVGFIPEITFKDVSFKYPGSESNALTNLDFFINPGSIVAIVGPSGAGKTTLVDILLGINQPTSGSVLISGLGPLECIEAWPGAIAYVPQEISISNMSIRKNISLGFPDEVASDELVLGAMKKAAIESLVSESPNGLESDLGQSGSRISGGQKQRIAVARAFFTNPKLIVFDEATSALDTETESIISKTIYSMRGETTVILIAHRLSTVKNADLVIYLDNGQITASGTFDEVRSKLPNFDKQSKLMGL
jgi:ABC-type multidrug transport system fused ATPase/permease subunit